MKNDFSQELIVWKISGMFVIEEKFNKDYDWKELDIFQKVEK